MEAQGRPPQGRDLDGIDSVEIADEDVGLLGTIRALGQDHFVACRPERLDYPAGQHQVGNVGDYQCQTGGALL